MKERTEEVFRLAATISDTRKILREIRTAATDLQRLLWSEEEKRERDDAVENFDASMRAMVYFTIKNLEAYQRSTWMELFDREEGAGDGAELSV